MFTANSMNCLCEALGLALPGNGTILATDPERDELCPGRRPQRSWSWSRRTSRPGDILTAEAIDNAFALDMAMGGSTNTVLHTLAIAHEAGVDYPAGAAQRGRRSGCPTCARSPRVQRTTWKTCTGPAASAPSSRARQKDGAPHLDCMTVTGKTLGENIAGAKSRTPR